MKKINPFIKKHKKEVLIVTAIVGSVLASVIIYNKGKNDLLTSIFGNFKELAIYKNVEENEIVLTNILSK